MSTWAKLYNKLLLNRLHPVLDQILRSNQACFRPGRSTVDQINALHRIIEAAERRNLPLTIIFVDFKKAFDTINRAALFHILLQYGIPEKIVSAIKMFFDNSKGVAAVNGRTSDPFDITTGVLQGDVLASFSVHYRHRHSAPLHERKRVWIRVRAAQELSTSGQTRTRPRLRGRPGSTGKTSRQDQRSARQAQPRSARCRLQHQLRQNRAYGIQPARR